MAYEPVPGLRLYGEPVPPARRDEAVAQSAADFAGAVPRPAIRQFLHQIILGPQMRWSLISIGKNASSSTLRHLYELDFGHPLTARFTSTTDINPSAVIHQLAGVGVFSRALLEGLSVSELHRRCPLRLLVCRHPVERAVSAFRYLCLSNETGATWFARDRLRMDASVGFDWQTMPDTIEGFRRFLRYVELEIETQSVHALNGHWKPQVAFSHPDIYQPTLIGRMENLGAFFDEIAARLDRAPPAGSPADNRQPAPPSDLAADPDARRLIERLYAEDFERFGY